MKHIKFLFVAIACLTFLTAKGQAVTTSPITVTQSTKNIVITFHADGGSRGLADTPGNGKIYAHTGVITNLSKNSTDWRYATKWDVNDPKYLMQYAAPNRWTLTIPDIREFYGITNPDEVVEKLCFVFRNDTRTREGKAGGNADIMVQIFPENFPGSTQLDYPGGIPKMGAVNNADGSVTFCLAAPGKKNVVMMASWNQYAVSPENVMHYQDYNDVRYFWLTVPNLVGTGAHSYYYNVDGSIQVGDPYGHLILDGYNDAYIPSSVFPDLPVFPEKGIKGVPCVVYDSTLGNYEWQTGEFHGVPQSQLIVYELLIRDFTGTEGQKNGNGTVRGVIEKLDYLKDLGVNAIELLPIMEFSGNNSWGYNPNFLMAPDKFYGRPQDYKELVDKAHERGMAVILDIVLNQCDGMHPWFGMWDRLSNKFINGSAPHAYSVLYDWNQDYPLVQQQWYDTLEFWLKEYRVDGFRFDLVKGLGNSSSYGTKYYPETNSYANPSDAATNAYNATRVARMKDLHSFVKEVKPDAYFINENLATAKEENEMAEDGEINWANVNYSSVNYACGKPDDSALSRFFAPYDDNRLWGSTMSYAESHDEQRVAYEVDRNGVAGVKGNLDVTMRRLGSLAAQMILTPGAHLIWQFEELGDNQNTKNSSGNNTDPKYVRWSYLENPQRAGLHSVYSALNKIRGCNPELFEENASRLINLSGWFGRTISLVNGGKELYLLVNPSTDGDVDVRFPTNPATNTSVNLAQGYELIANSYGLVPSMTNTAVTLKPGAFAVYGKALSTGIDEIAGDTENAPRIIVRDGIISVLSCYETMNIYGINGKSYRQGERLPGGIYVVVIDDKAQKVLVK